MKDNDTISKGFKMTEVGLLPEEWEVVKVTDVFELSRKPRNLFIDGDKEIPFIPMELISEDTKSVNGYQIKKYSEISSGTFVLKNDLIVAKITPSFENGKQAIIDNMPIDYGYATTEVWALHPKENRAIVEHLYSYLKIKNVRAAIASKMEGTTGRQRLPRHVVENLMIPLPPLPEQKKIAAVLSVVQETKKKTEAVIGTARELRKSLMKYLFNYGPVPMEKAENVPLKETEVGLLPEEWEVVKVTDVFELSRKPRNLFIDGDKEIPFIPMELISEDSKSVNGYQIKKYSEISSGTFVLKNDLIVAKITPSFENGKQAIIDNMPIDYGYATTEVWALHPKENRAIVEHLYSYLKIKNVRAAIASKMEGTTGRQRLPRHVVENLMIPLPPLLIQQKIAEILSAVDKKIEAEENKKKALEELFKTLLNNFMTAEIRVNHLRIAV